jgi:hypothetical protein
LSRALSVACLQEILNNKIKLRVFEYNKWK